MQAFQAFARHFQRLRHAAFAPCDLASLVVFRVAFGLILFWESVRYFTLGWIEGHFLIPRFHFKYLGFGWVTAWPNEGLYWHFLALACAALFVAAGFWHRMASAWLCVGWTYVLLLEKAAYLNHLYLICLLAFLLTFVPVDRAWSITVLRQPHRRCERVPILALWLLRGQLAIPYVFGALAKLNGDWLQGQPMQMWMSRMSHIRSAVPFFGEMWLALLFSYSGFVLDLLVVPLLLWRRTRTIAFLAAVTFHLLNALMFRIGIFPWMMICATTLFFAPDWPRRWFGRSSIVPNQALPDEDINDWQKSGLLAIVLLWFAVQLTLPFRHWLVPGDVDWTEEESRFAWRMMLTDKAAAMRITAVNPQTLHVQAVDPREYLLPWQLKYLGYDPDLLVQFSHFLADELTTAEGVRPEIHIEDYCSLNGRPPRLLVDPRVDLASQQRTWFHQPWIIPLNEPLPKVAWDQSPETWFDRPPR